MLFNSTMLTESEGRFPFSNFLAGSDFTTAGLNLFSFIVFFYVSDFSKYDV